jgi:SAM-dependent methyltransferase
VIQRTHDKQVYLAEDRYEKPKELSKLLLALLRQSGGLRSDETVCDVGCAAGEFLYYLRQQYPASRYYGVDVVPELIEKARTKVPDVEFKVGSILDRRLMPAASMDVSFSVGVLPIFEEFRSSFDNLLYWTKPGGRVYVAALFNPHPVDVWVTYRLSDDPDSERRESGWNMFSKRSVSRYLDAVVGPESYSFTPFEMPFDLQPNSQDPARTWTFLDHEGRRLITNGLSLICNVEILEIRP